jgi:hypothetical protein
MVSPKHAEVSWVLHASGWVTRKTGRRKKGKTSDGGGYDVNVIASRW